MKRFLEYLLVFILACAFFSIYQFQRPWLPETDGYYHLKNAWVLGHEGFFRNFKWAWYSLWREHYSDKEFLFHVWLIPFTYFKDLATGGKIATVFMAAFSFTSFYVILKLNKVRYAWFWVLLLTMSGGYFLYRINVPRPQALSVVLAMWSIHFLINRKRLPLVILCFFYTFSYTAYHLPLVFACIIFGYQLIFDRKDLDWKTPLLVGAGMVAGMLCSPYFPDNLRMFYLQNFYILLKGATETANLHMGGEFYPMDTKAALTVNIMSVITFLAVVFAGMFSPRSHDKKTIKLFLVAMALVALTCISKRFAEYSVPVTLMFCAFYFKPYLENFELRNYLIGKYFWYQAGVLAILAGLSISSFFNTVYEFRGGASKMQKAAEYLKQHTNDNEIVFTGDWDDAPELFFYNHKNRYFVILDPNFMYYWDPAFWTEWDKASHGYYGSDTYNIFKNKFHIRYGVATSDFTELKMVISNDKRMEIVLDYDGAYVFHLKD